MVALSSTKHNRAERKLKLIASFKTVKSSQIGLRLSLAFFAPILVPPKANFCIVVVVVVAASFYDVFQTIEIVGYT